MVGGYSNKKASRALSGDDAQPRLLFFWGNMNDLDVGSIIVVVLRKSVCGRYVRSLLFWEKY